MDDRPLLSLWCLRWRRRRAEGNERQTERCSCAQRALDAELGRSRRQLETLPSQLTTTHARKSLAPPRRLESELVISETSDREAGLEE